jgi:hypothetical protein
MRTGTAVALGVGAVIIAGGATAAVFYLRRASQPAQSPPLPKAEGERLITQAPPSTRQGQAPAPGSQVPAQSDASRIAGDVKAYAGAVKDVTSALGDIATEVKGWFA